VRTICQIALHNRRTVDWRPPIAWRAGDTHSDAAPVASETTFCFPSARLAFNPPAENVNNPLTQWHHPFDAVCLGSDYVRNQMVSCSLLCCALALHHSSKCTTLATASATTCHLCGEAI